MPHYTIQIIRGFSDPDRKTDAYLLCHLHESEKIVPFEAKIICADSRVNRFELNRQTPKHDMYKALTQFEEDKKYLSERLRLETKWLSNCLIRVRDGQRVEITRVDDLSGLLEEQREKMERARDQRTLQEWQKEFKKVLQKEKLQDQYAKVRRACQITKPSPEVAAGLSFLDWRFYINPSLSWPDLKPMHEKESSAYFASIHLQREIGSSRLIDQYRLKPLIKNFEIDLADKLVTQDQLLGVIFPAKSQVWYDHISQDAREAMGFTAEQAGEIEDLMMKQFVVQFDEVRAQLVPVAEASAGGSPALG